MSLLTLVRRFIDPRFAPLSRAATSLSALGAVLTYATFAVTGQWLAGVPAAMLVGVLVAWFAFFVVDGQQRTLQESRDLWGLTGVMLDGRPWPAPGGWALGADAIGLLLREISARGLRTVVELGPGTSSVVLSRSNLELEMYGLEHDEGFVRSVRNILDLHGSAYTLIPAPLVKSQEGGRTVDWYDPSVLAQLPDRLDVLIVDGPPNWKGAGNRSPAWPKLRDRMPIGGIVLVDDCHRADERSMALGWARDGGVRVLFDAGQYIALEVI